MKFFLPWRVIQMSATVFRTFSPDMKKGLRITHEPLIYSEFLVGSASFELAPPRFLCLI